MSDKIIFKNPLKESSIKDLVKVDLHTHTTVSDGFCEVKDIINMANDLKIGVSIADHNEIKSSVEICKQKKVFSIPAIEVTGRDFIDLLIYFYSVKDLQEFYEKHIRKNEIPDHGFQFHRLTWYTSELIMLAKKYPCLIVLPHPYTRKPKNSYRFFRKRKEMLKQIDAIEGLNSLIRRKSNLLSIGWAQSIGKPITGGSDAHELHQVGKTVTCCKHSSVSGFLDDIRKKKSKVVGLEVGFFDKVSTSYKIFRQNWKEWKQ